MYKLITFDGFMASGKNTYAEKLCHYLGIESTSDNVYNQILNIIDRIMLFRNDEIFRVLTCLGSINYAHNHDWRKRDLVVIRNYWRNLLEAEAFDNKLIDAFETIITRNGEILPICSFYLHISTYESRVRFMKREAVLNGMSLDANSVGVEGVSPPDYFAEIDEHRQKTVNAFAERYPFFHVIDGMRPENGIFDEIVSITEESLG